MSVRRLSRNTILTLTVPRGNQNKPGTKKTREDVHLLFSYIILLMLDQYKNNQMWKTISIKLNTYRYYDGPIWRARYLCNRAINKSGD